MRILGDQRGVSNPDSNYEFGKVVNEVTYLDEEILADLIYNFQKIALRAGALNGLPENINNGYQFIDGLNSFVRDRTMQQRGAVTAADFDLTDITQYDAASFDAAAGDELDLSSIITNIGANWVLLQIVSSTDNVNYGDGGEIHLYKSNMASTTNINVTKHHNVRYDNGALKIKKIEEVWVEINPGERKIYAKIIKQLSGFDSVSIIVKSWQRYY